MIAPARRSADGGDGLVLALSGGIGGAKLAWGLAQCLPVGSLAVVANTGDDFEHLGLSISPDIDTLTYTLAGLDNPELGWGRRDETWSFKSALAALGGETWFALGDGDLAVHIERTRRLRAGETLSDVTDRFRTALGIAARILPMSDDPVRTQVRAEDGWLEFQDYFVRRRCEPRVLEIAFHGADRARPLPAIIEALRRPDLRAVVVCPSNPFISVLPILSLPGIRSALAECKAPRLAVSPIIRGAAVKGPTAKMMAELGHEVTSASAARLYEGLLDAMIVDEADAELDHGIRTVAAQTLMTTGQDKVRLAELVLSVADALALEGDAGSAR